MSEPNFIIRNATFEEMPTLLDWCRLQGWNPGKHDARSFYDADPAGFFVGTLDGALICSICGIKYGSNYGFVGFYIAQPEYRGKGYGLQIFNYCMEYLKGRNVGLDGAAAQQHNYIKSGFSLLNNSIRYEGVGTGTYSTTINSRVKSVSEVPFDAILAYDTIHFGEERSSFLKSWLNAPENHCYCVYEDGNVKGVGGIRPAAETYRIGPLFADSKEIARELLNVLRSQISTEDRVQIQVPDLNGLALELMSEVGFKVVKTLGRMYTKGLPNVPHDHIFGTTSTSLG